MTNERDSEVEVVHGCQVSRRRLFYSKRLIFGVLASDAVRQLSTCE